MKQTVFYNFDWDDNIMFMPTKIVVFSKTQNNSISEISLSTEDFAHHRNEVSKVSKKVFVKKEDDEFVICSKEESEAEVDLLDYEICGDDHPTNFSFRNFRDSEDCHFMKDMKKALRQKDFGPSFKDFQDACSTEETAAHVKIITARGQSPKTIHRGMNFLKEMGLIKHTPKVENVFPVSYNGSDYPDKYKSSASSPQEAKMKVLEDCLDEVGESSSNVYFGFSDDDKNTYEYVRDYMKKQVESNRWPNVHIDLYFTGNREKKREEISTYKKVG